MKKMQVFIFFVLLSVVAMAQDSIAKAYIVINKSALKLFLIGEENADTLMVANIGVGKEIGNKTKDGDNRTPEGEFFVSEIVSAKYWIHNFNDGGGFRKHAYGDWFIRLEVPKFKGIGIHGTCFAESIGSRCTEGCVRLSDEDLENLKERCYVGMRVVILPDEGNEQ